MDVTVYDTSDIPDEPSLCDLAIETIQKVINQVSRLGSPEDDEEDFEEICHNLQDILTPYMDIHRQMVAFNDPELKASRRLSQIMEFNT
jgi:hypothetical protein